MRRAGILIAGLAIVASVVFIALEGGPLLGHQQAISPDPPKNIRRPEQPIAEPPRVVLTDTEAAPGRAPESHQDEAQATPAPPPSTEKSDVVVYDPKDAVKGQMLGSVTVRVSECANESAVTALRLGLRSRSQIIGFARRVCSGALNLPELGLNREEAASIFDRIANQELDRVLRQ